MLILQLNETTIDLGVLKEMRNMYERLFEYEEQVGEYLNYVAIKKDSIIGHYLITHVDNKIIINEYLFIDQKKIINAIDIALLEKNQEIKEGKKHYCKSCGKLLDNNSTYCLECSHKIQRVVERPTRQELKNLIRTQPFTKIANKYNVSDNAIRKWCISEKLPTKKSFINSLTDEQWEEI